MPFFIIEVKEAYVDDGKKGIIKVCVGDQVELKNPDDKQMLNYLGPGPYTIEWMCKWRCGRYFLQVKTSGRSGGGANTYKFKIST